MLRTLCASTLIALVVCPVTAPFGAIDPAEQHADRVKHSRPLAPGRSAVTGTPDPTAVAVIPRLPVAHRHTPRTRTLALPSVRAACGRFALPDAVVASARLGLPPTTRAALPTVLRL